MPFDLSYILFFVSLGISAVAVVLFLWLMRNEGAPHPAGRSLREEGPSASAGTEAKRGETPRAPPLPPGEGVLKASPLHPEGGEGEGEGGERP